MRTPMRVHFIEYNAKVGTLQLYQVFPKYGTALLATILRDRGYDARIFLEGVSDMAIEKLADCDVACFPVFGATLNKVRACAAGSNDFARIFRNRTGISTGPKSRSPLSWGR